VSDAFLDEAPSCLTRGRKLEETQRSNARPGDITDGQKARGADQWRLGLGLEIVAGALQDHHRQPSSAPAPSARARCRPSSRLLERRAPAHDGALLHAVGPLDPGQGIEPEAVVEEELPDDLKAKADLQNTKGEANLRGHLKGEEGGAKGEGDDEAESGSLILCGAGEGQRHPAPIRTRIFCAASSRSTLTLRRRRRLIRRALAG